MIDSPTSCKTDRTGSPRIEAPRSVGVNRPTPTRRISRSMALALYERELAYYRADEQYLTVEKCAERCAKLSLLLTQAQVA
jgi:hypothetical protein